MPDLYQNTDAGRHKRAAEGHLSALHDLYHGGHYSLTYYVAGLAVETLFRAYVYRIRNRVIKGHDLLLLAEEGKFFNYVPEGRREQIEAAVGEVKARWHNLFRYLSEDALRAELRSRGLLRLSNGRSIKGDIVLYNSKIIVDNATEILNLGLTRWTFSKS